MKEHGKGVRRGGEGKAAPVRNVTENGIRRMGGERHWKNLLWLESS